MARRNRHLGRQLRAAQRQCRSDAGVIVFRAKVSRGAMARVMVGDLDVSLGVYELVAEQLDLSTEFVPWRADGGWPAPGGVLETVVDRATARLAA